MRFLPQSRFLTTVRSVIRHSMADDIMGLAAELAYRQLLAVFPFFIFLAALGGFIASVGGIENPTQQIMDQLRDQLPSDAASVLEGQLEAVLENQNAGLLSFGIIAAIWASSAAMNTLIKALNRAYEVKETRPFWKKLPIALGLTVISGLFFVGSFTVIIVGQLFADDIGELVGLGREAGWLVSVMRFPVVFMLLIIAMAFLYWAAPNTKIKFRLITPGAVFFVVTWILVSLGFALYVSQLGSYQSTYGTLGGVVVLMLWFYITSLVMMIGAELNAVVRSGRVSGAEQEKAAGAKADAAAKAREPQQFAGESAVLPRMLRVGGAVVGTGIGLVTLRRAWGGKEPDDISEEGKGQE